MAYELIKVSELPELTTPSGPNVIPIQDGDYLKRISFENLKEAATEDVADDLAAEVTARESAVSGEATARGNADTAILADLASPYSASATYAVGDYCTKDGVLKRCNTAITTAEAWNSAHWDDAKLGGDVSTLRSALSNITEPKMYPNLLDITAIVSGYISNNSGSISEYSDWHTTDFMPIEYGQTYTFSRTDANNDRVASFFYFCLEYDANKAPIAASYGTSATSEFTPASSDAKFLRFSFHLTANTRELCFQEGTSKKYYPYGIETYAIKEGATPEIPSIQDDINGIKKGTALDAVFVDRVITVDDSTNLYDHNTMITTGKWIGADGAIQNDANSAYAKIPVIAGEKYLICYHANKPPFASTQAGAYVIQSNDNTTVSVVLAETLTSGSDIDGYATKYIDIPTNGAYLLLTVKLSTTWDDTENLLIYSTTLTGGNLISLYGATLSLTKKWQGKKWTCVGDSLTEHNIRAIKNYDQYVAESTGITVVNMGRSGTGYMRTYDEGYAFYQRIANVPTDSDVVTIFGSGNDLLYIADLGTPTDSGEADNPTTICGCINKTIDNLIAIMPAVQLGIVAPTPWIGNQPTLDNSSGMSKYVEALRQICYLRSIPFLDLYHSSNLRPWTVEGRAACYSRDEGNGVHPDEVGQKLIASRFEGFLDSLILGN